MEGEVDNRTKVVAVGWVELSQVLILQHPHPVVMAGWEQAEAKLRCNCSSGLD